MVEFCVVVVQVVVLGIVHGVVLSGVLVELIGHVGAGFFLIVIKIFFEVGEIFVGIVDWDIVRDIERILERGVGWYVIYAGATERGEG